jgi:1A family penicillin-binding protein
MNQNRQRRSYGFEQDDTPKTSPRIRKAAQRQQEESSHRGLGAHARQPLTRNAHQRSYWHLLWIIPAGIVVGIIRILAWLWQRRPRLSSTTKGYIRKKIVSIAIIIIALGFISGTIIVAWASKDLPDPNKLTDRQVAQSTKIYDRTGDHLLYEIFADQKRTIIELDQISEHIINGVIATEDTTFFEHKGIRPMSILRAIVVGILPGNRIQGTSTLTQQLVKNAILTNERSVTRKIKEAILSIRLEQKYTKEQILKIFFNEIPYGSTNYGVESAAQAYFGKSANEVTLQEAATLAGLPKAPSTYLKNTDSLKQRRDFVLRRMYEEGYITEQEKNDAQAEPLTLERNFSQIKAPHFVLYVREQLVEQFGEQLVDTGGLSVITTLDWEKQQIAEEVIADVGTRVLETAGANNTSLLALDPKNGHILTMVGSKNFFDESINGQFNVATQARRQPGSSFKPIVFAAAFEKGYTPDTILYDVVTDFGANSGTSYTPLNYNLQELGPVSMRKALQGSLNIPAVKALYLVGEQAGIDFAKRLGYSTFANGDFGLSLVLGGGEVILLEHVAAYGIFANNGVRHTPVSIISVTDANNDILFELKTEKGEKVLEPEISATLSNVLADDPARQYTFGAGSVLTLPGRPVASKTGTTNGFVDGWTVGYTPSLVAGVWAGNTNNTPMKSGFGGSNVAGPIWNAFMRRALEGSPVESFPEPPINDATKPVLRGTESGSVTVRVNKVTGNLASSSTPEQLIEERTFIQGNSILHFVNKDDPRGPIPEDPSVDPQYSIWEAAIQDWIRRKQETDPEFSVSFDAVPTTVDTEYSIELIPTLEVVYPEQNTIITDPLGLYTDIRVTAPRGVSVVRYYLNDQIIGVETNHPFNLQPTQRNLDPGTYTLTIEVEDDIGNNITNTVNISWQVPE